jgi:predicted DNA-binding transcriptional regulator AlpA
MLLRARNCLLCLDQEQSAGCSVSMPEPDRIIRLKTVLSRTGLSRSTIYRKMSNFPRKRRTDKRLPSVEIRMAIRVLK